MQIPASTPVMPSATLGLEVSAALTALAVGLQVHPRDALAVLRDPERAGRSTISMSVVALGLAGWLGNALALDPALRLGLILLAVTGLPLVTGWRALQPGRDLTMANELAAGGSLLSVVLLPITLLACRFWQDVPVRLQPTAVCIAGCLVVPLALGFVVRAFSPAMAERLAHTARVLASALLVLSLFTVLIRSWSTMYGLLDDGTVMALLAIAAATLLAGHLLGGPYRADRATLALASAARHPGLAVGIAAAAYPASRRVLEALAAVAFLVVACVAVPYLRSSMRAVEGAPVRGQPHDRRRTDAPASRARSSRA